jgi:hypothetical protein
MWKFMLHASVFTLSSTADCDLRAALFFLGLMACHYDNSFHLLAGNEIQGRGTT